MNKEDMNTVTLYLDDDQEIDCDILCYLTVKEQEYIALLPPEDEASDEPAPVYLYRFSMDENGEPGIEKIEDNEEFELVCEAYDEWLDTQEYEAIDLDALGLDPLE